MSTDGSWHVKLRRVNPHSHKKFPAGIKFAEYTYAKQKHTQMAINAKVGQSTLKRRDGDQISDLVTSMR